MQDYTGKQIDRYHIQARQGMGGMAVVYKAYDVRLEREVALKLIRTEEIPPSQHERMMKRFEREAKAMAKFSHPNIVSVYDYGEFNGSPYLVMDFVAGGTLKEKMKSPILWRQAVGWVMPVAAALGYAHARGVIHRDVKPGNILFDESGRVLLTDFGIAKILAGDGGNTLTGTGMGVGTPEYMAPEQGMGREVDGRADVYALGVVLYEMVTGRKPYAADTPMAVVFKHMSDPLPSPRGVNKDLPERLEKVLYKALAKQPQERYADMTAFGSALEKVLSEAETGEFAAQMAAENTPAQATVGSEDETRDAFEVPVVMQKRQRGGKQGGKKLPVWVWVGLGALALLGLMAGLGSQLVKLGAGGTGPLAMLATATQTSTATLTPTLTKTATPTKTATLTPTATMGVGSSKVNEQDGAVLVYVPAGEFVMGTGEDDIELILQQGWCESCQASWFEDEQPAHTVDVDAFWMYQTEVTNGQYRQCIEAGVCGGVLSDYTNNQHPAVYIDWYEARDYCAWAGGRLPTEAEWEKAARGTDGRTYPWGEAAPNCNLAQYGSCKGGTVPVGSFPAGASPYGVLDMAGNVWEWVSDWYSADYYSSSPDENPTGPASGTYKVVRGGSWYGYVRYLRASDRGWSYPDYSNFNYGFRCLTSE